MMRTHIVLSMILSIIITQQLVKSQEMYKSLPRINRANRGPDDFEKFFLKASKSVPRIGRRNFNMDNLNRQSSLYQYPKGTLPFKIYSLPKIEDQFDDLSWNDLADKIEYYPEILVSPAFLMQDDLKDLNSIEKKRQDNLQKTEQNKEITEYRFQPES